MNEEIRSLNAWRIMALGSAVAKAAFAEQAWRAHQHCTVEYVAKIDEVCARLRQSRYGILAERDFFASVAKSIEVLAVCRVKNCGFYGKEWIHAQNSEGLFRCAHCGGKQGWEQKRSWLQFQRVILVSHPFTGERWVIPSMVPHGADDFFRKLFKAAASNLPTGSQAIRVVTNLDINHVLEKLQALDALLSNVGQPANFKHFPLYNDTKAFLMSCSQNDFGPTQYAMFEEHGFYGNILNAKLCASAPFTEWTEFAALFVSLLLACEEPQYRPHCT